jgi:hypothetical protein
MSTIDRAIDYCTAFDPSLPAKLRGASEEDVAALERRLERPLPDPHRRFLERMGKRMAWLAPGTFDASAAGLLALYATTRGVPPSGVSVFAVAHDELQEDMFLVERGDELRIETHNTMRGCGYEGFSLEHTGTVAGSIEELLCLAAVRRCVVAPMPLAATWEKYRVGPEWLAKVERLGDEAGLVALWFSSSITRVLVRAGTAMIAHRSPDSPLVVEVASMDAAAYRSLAPQLTELLGVEGRGHP